MAVDYDNIEREVTMLEMRSDPDRDLTKVLRQLAQAVAALDKRLKALEKRK